MQASTLSAGYWIWGSELSPFALKLRALLEYAAVPYAWLPGDGGRLQNTRAWWRMRRAVARRSAIRYPSLTDLDEYPLVPFLLLPDGAVHYDTSAIAQWLDDRRVPASEPLIPEAPALAFVVRLIDEALDEFGLYMVHHARWVTSATTNDAGKRLAHELRRILPPGGSRLVARQFPRRQVRRLPYLFSVGQPSASRALPGALTPPPRPGFPATHALLEGAWSRYLAAIDAIVATRPYLLGDRFTLADASVYGQLGMNLSDPSAADRMRTEGPRAHAWLERVRERAHVGSTGALRLDSTLAPLLEVIMATFVPLMRQNARAYEHARGRGQSSFNERAFDAGQALYDGTLMGQPFRAVIKTFQVRVWHEVRTAWHALPASARREITTLVGDAEDAFA